MAKHNNKESETLERGDVLFFYRPRVQKKQAKGRGDLQRLYMVLHPHGKDRFRLAVIGRKVMPDPSAKGKERMWGFVETVRKNPESIRDELAGEEYKTKTRGTREVPTARPAGEGVYRIVRHDGHTHLAYMLELPKKRRGVQEELNIQKQASYVISIANPERSSPRPAGLRSRQQASYSQRLKKKFRGRKFSEADPPDFLNKQGAEFLLIAAAEDVKKDLGMELQPQDENKSSAEVFRHLKVDRSKRPTEPLLKGEWK
ncbi:MAG: hypothetical protein GF331_06900 [Chitinivibrionales bacterium]|nr:hypothetical protein [Chitinivibrionales bacterium]